MFIGSKVSRGSSLLDHVLIHDFVLYVFLQVYHWTKTCQVEEHPLAIEELRKSVDLNLFRKLIEKNIIVARNFETQEEFVPQSYPFGLIQNILRTVLTNAHHYPQLINLHIAHEPDVAATWTHMGQVIAVRGRPGTFLNSKERLPEFYSEAVVKESCKYEFESMGQISPYVDLQQWKVKNENSTGFYRSSMFPYFHTLIMVDNQAVPEVQLIQKGIMYTFGQLLAQVTRKYGDEIVGRQVPEPECAQCIVTNGKRFSFIWYQLNTLDIGDVNEGVKNLVCIERPGLLYSKISSVRGKRLRRIEDLDDDILRTLLSVLLLS